LRHFVLANTLGFVAGYPYSRHSISWLRLRAIAAECSANDWYSARAAC